MAGTQEMVRKRSWREIAGSYFGGLAHNHTVLSNHRGHHESDLSVDRLVRTLVKAGLAGEPDAPLQYLMLNEHPSDPARPRKLGSLSLRGRRLLRQRRRPIVQRVPMLYGLEVSLLPSGNTDLTPRLADHCDLVIASRHALPSTVEREPEAIMELFKAACYNPAIEVLGHPPRYIEDIPEVDWPKVFKWAKRTGTAVEVNANHFPTPDSHPIQKAFWPVWLKYLADSGAAIFIGTDIHNHYQLNDFIRQWRLLDREGGEDTHIYRFLKALMAAGIETGQVVTATHEGLAEWLVMDKAARARLDYGK